jgi:ABC-type uncharacterized transport system YnjBCD permease subunit
MSSQPWYQDEAVYGANKWSEFGFDIELMDVIRAYHDIMASNDTALKQRVEVANGKLNARLGVRVASSVFAGFVALIYLIFSTIRMWEMSSSKKNKTRKHLATKSAVHTLVCYDANILVMSIIEVVIQMTDYSGADGKLKCNVVSFVSLLINMCSYASTASWFDLIAQLRNYSNSCAVSLMMNRRRQFGYFAACDVLHTYLNS